MWINAFLTDRYQCVIIEHCFSEWSPVINGVPLGSVLGPILFIMYIDDIFEVLLGSAVTHQLFADDLKLFSTVKTPVNAASLRSTLDRPQQWCINWQLIVTTQKCSVLHLGKTNSQIQYTLDGCRIIVAQSVTDL
jgi:ribonucleases P/MRP protein subunit RPP40